MTAYYNEIDPYAAAWLRNLIDAGHIAPGIVDERSIVDVQPADLEGFRQCHFFAGIAGWSLAARLAGWPDDRELWTGSAPCQPFSVAGAGRAQADDRHLWPHLFRLVRARRPAVLMGEQVAAAVGKDWLDGISADLEGIRYARRAVVVPACAVNAPHRRDRLWFIADARGNVADTTVRAHEQGQPQPGFWSVPEVDGCGDASARGGDGKARRVKPGIRLLAHGVSARVGKLRAYGNAIVPQVAAEVIAAYMDTLPSPASTESTA